MWDDKKDEDLLHVQVVLPLGVVCIPARGFRVFVNYLGCLAME